MAYWLPLPAFALGAAGIVEKGNRLYHDQKYVDAAKQYDQALFKQPDSAVINFDAGTAQYKTNDYQKANSSFEKSLITEDKQLEIKANYNLGNSKYMLGLTKENTDLSSAVQLLEGALNNYKRTQELGSKDDDAKVNYKIVEEKLKELKEKLKQQPQESKDNQKQQKRNQDQAENQQESASALEEQEKSKDKQGQDQPSQQSAQVGQEKQEQSARSESEELKEMSKEEANMLLEGYRQEENVTGMLKDVRKGTEGKVLKDW